MGTAAHGQMPIGILHHDNRVIDQDADRKDQGEECDPVDRVADQHGGKEREGERRGNGQRDDHRRPHAQGQSKKQHYGHHRNQQMPQQFVRLVIGRLPVIARDRDAHV